MPGTPELMIIFILVLVLFGPNKIPELARGLGKGLREFRKASHEIRKQLKFDDDE